MRVETRAVSNETETHSCPYIELKLYNETLRNMYNMSGFRNGFRFHLKTLPKRNPQQRNLSFFTVFSCFVVLRVSFWVSFSFLWKRSGCATLYKVHRVSFRDASRVATRTALVDRVTRTRLCTFLCHLSWIRKQRARRNNLPCNMFITDPPIMASMHWQWMAYCLGNASITWQTFPPRLLLANSR